MEVEPELRARPVRDDARGADQRSVLGGDPVTGVGDEPVRRRESRDHPALRCLSLDPDRDCQCAPSDPPPSTRGPYRSRRDATHGVGTAAGHPTVPLSCRRWRRPIDSPRRDAPRAASTPRAAARSRRPGRASSSASCARPWTRGSSTTCRSRASGSRSTTRAGDWALAFHVLRNAGAAPPWIEADKARPDAAGPARRPGGPGREVAADPRRRDDGIGRRWRGSSARRTPRSRT